MGRKHLDPDGGETPGQPTRGRHPRLQTWETPENPDGGETQKNQRRPEEKNAITYSRLYWDTSLTDPIPPKPEEHVVVETAKPYKQEGEVFYFSVKKYMGARRFFKYSFRGGGEEKKEAPLVLEQRTEDKEDGFY